MSHVKKQFWMICVTYIHSITLFQAGSTASLTATLISNLSAHWLSVSYFLFLNLWLKNLQPEGKSLCIAAKYGHVDIVNLLLETKVDIDSVDIDQVCGNEHKPDSRIRMRNK
jgi:hypothetical protein